MRKNNVLGNVLFLGVSVYVLYYNQATIKTQYIIIITVHSHNTLYNHVLHWLKCSVMWWQYELYAYRGPYKDMLDFWTRFLQLKFYNSNSCISRF